MTQSELTEAVALTARITFFYKLKETKKKLNALESYHKWLCTNRLEELKVELPNG